MRHLSSVWIAMLVLLANRIGSAQEQFSDADADRAPRFLLASASGQEPLPVDVARTPSLRRRISIAFSGVMLKQALSEIARKGNLSLVYSRDMLALESPVHLAAENITVAGALSEVLLDAGVDVLMTPDGRAALVRRPPPVQNGSVSGRVTDGRTSAAIVGATVAIDQTSRSATTDGDGRYRIVDVAPGTYVVRVRYIGYAPGTASVTVSADQETTADFALEKSAQKLDELVTVTPGGMQTELKALPTPITVITAEQIDAQNPRTINEVFRQHVPTGVGFATSNQPFFTDLRLRGASSISGRSSAKVFIDGVEATATSLSPIDPASIERVEVLRGPQASTLYGPEAASGVIQVFTKQGYPGQDPQLVLRAQGGILQTPYAGAGTAIRQQYNASVLGGTGDVKYNIGGSWMHQGDWLPFDAPTSQSNPSVFAGLGYRHGMLSIDLNARYFRSIVPLENSPEFAAVGGHPNYSDQESLNSTYGARVGLAPTEWWRHQLSVGYDDQTLSQVQYRPYRTTPGDTLLTLYENPSRKSSIFYNTSVSGRLAPDFEGSLVAGIDYYRTEEGFTYTFGAVNTSGTIRPGPGFGVAQGRTEITNTGWLAQGELSWRETVFLTTGLRADDNSTFGSEAGNEVSPKVGLSTVWELPSATIKLRGAYGRATKPAGSGLAFGYSSPTLIVLPNPELRPERQRGWDGGVDVIFGSVGTLSVTGFSQVAEDLITQVTVPSTSVTTWKYLNLGRVRNRGVEVEASVQFSPVTIRAQYGYVDSRVEDVGPEAGATSAVVVGDRPFWTPAHTAGGQVSVAVRSGTTVNAGATYVGSWSFLDNIALARCFAGELCPPGFPPSNRGFVIEFPGFLKLNAQVSHQVTPQLRGFVSVDNLTNNDDFEFGNAVPRTGRLTMVGLEARL